MNKDEKIKELLAMLDLPEEKQRYKIAEYITPKPWEHFIPAGFSPSHGGDVCEKCRKKLRTWQEQESECSVIFPYSDSLADLAFRLRDETDKIEFGKTIGLIYRKIAPPFGRMTEEMAAHAMLGWLLSEGQPIHFIIATLIAKVLAEKE